MLGQSMLVLRGQGSHFPDFYGWTSKLKEAFYTSDLWERTSEHPSAAPGLHTLSTVVGKTGNNERVESDSFAL